MKQIILINRLLLLIILLGGVLVVREQWLISRLKPAFSQLVEKYGGFHVQDASRIHAQLIALEGRTWTWRLYLPPNMKSETSILMPGGSSTWSGLTRESFDGVFFLRMRDDLDERLHVFAKKGGSSTVTRIDSETTRFMLKHWEQLVIRVAGQNDVVSNPPDKPLLLFSIQVPEDLRDEFLELHPASSAIRRNYHLVVVAVGASGAMNSVDWEDE